MGSSFHLTSSYNYVNEIQSNLSELIVLIELSNSKSTSRYSYNKCYGNTTCSMSSISHNKARCFRINYTSRFYTGCLDISFVWVISRAIISNDFRVYSDTQQWHAKHMITLDTSVESSVFYLCKHPNIFQQTICLLCTPF